MAAADDTGIRQPAEALLPEVYSELRHVAAALASKLRPGQTLQPTALVHEAYLRLVRRAGTKWEGRRHFFGAAAQAMREILIEQARRKSALKRGGAQHRIELAEGLAVIEPPSDDILALDEAVQELKSEDPRLAEIVELRYYAGLNIDEAAETIGISPSTVIRDWRFARAWLARRLNGPAPEIDHA